jgi:hypothetical protein
MRAAGIEWVPVDREELVGAILVDDAVDPASGEVLADSGEPLTDGAHRQAAGGGEAHGGRHPGLDEGSPCSWRP